ncbi:MAG TPA: hypothetical protein VF845_01865 [Terriglobales bacterium]
MRYRWNNSLFGKTALAAAALAGFLMFAGVPSLRADNDDCQRRVARADHRLHEAISHYGYRSRQAERRRHELREARERCWNRSHRWWNEHERRWHTDRDWDDHDHDRDH